MPIAYYVDHGGKVRAIYSETVYRRLIATEPERISE